MEDGDHTKSLAIKAALIALAIIAAVAINVRAWIKTHTPSSLSNVSTSLTAAAEGAELVPPWMGDMDFNHAKTTEQGYVIGYRQISFAAWARACRQISDGDLSSLTDAVQIEMYGTMVNITPEIQLEEKRAITRGYTEKTRCDYFDENPQYSSILKGISDSWAFKLRSLPMGYPLVLELK